MNELTRDDVPRYTDLLWPLLESYRKLGGSATNNQADDEVVRAEDYPEELQDIPVSSTNGRSLLSDRLAWARLHLKMAGLLESQKRALCTLTAFGWEIASQDLVRDLVKSVRKIYAKEYTQRRRRDDHAQVRTTERTQSAPDKIEGADTHHLAGTATTDPDTWQLVALVGTKNPDSDPRNPDEEVWIALLKSLLNDMCSIAFEHLISALLRAVGFTDVEVTGGSEDGGIDGHGFITEPDGSITMALMKSKWYFQAKCTMKNGTPNDIQKFKGAIANHGNRGLYFTLGGYGTQARDEAKQGAILVTLVSGVDLAHLLKDHSMGISTRILGTSRGDREEVVIDAAYFSGFPTCDEDSPCGKCGQNKKRPNED